MKKQKDSLSAKAAEKPRRKMTERAKALDITISLSSETLTKIIQLWRPDGFMNSC